MLFFGINSEMYVCLIAVIVHRSASSHPSPSHSSLLSFPLLGVIGKTNKILKEGRLLAPLWKKKTPRERIIPHSCAVLSPYLRSRHQRGHSATVSHQTLNQSHVKAVNSRPISSINTKILWICALLLPVTTSWERPLRSWDMRRHRQPWPTIAARPAAAGPPPSSYSHIT